MASNTRFLGTALLSGVLFTAALLLPACGGSGQPDGELKSVEDPARPGAVPAPEFPGGHTWFNVEEPLTIAALRGKVVVLDFWTLGCINCQHIIPDVMRLEEEFGDALVVIGVHSGKYDREQDDQSVHEAIIRFGLHHPVVNDPEFDIWSSYGVDAWPTIVVVDPAGNVFGSRAGEGVYAAVQPAIQQLVQEFDGELDRTPIAIDLESKGRTSSVLSFPSAVLADAAAGRLFIADAGRNRIVISGLDGVLQAVIGSGQPGLDDGTFAEATFRDPQGLALSPDGNTLYVADTRNHAVRAVDLATKEVSTVAGTGRRLNAYPGADAPALETSLASPWGLVVHEGSLYIAMAGTHQLWAMDLAGGTIAIFAGSGREGIADGPRLQATLAQPSGLTTDGASLFWVDPESSSVRRLPLTPDGAVTTIVGTGLFDFGDVDGLPPAARLQHPQGVAYSGGLLYVADTYNHKVRIVDPNTTAVRTLVGTGEAGFADGPATTASLNEPGGISIGSNIIFVADTNNNVIRRYELESATVSTLGFTNLRVAVQNVGGRTLKISLPGQTVSLESSTLRIRLTAPEGYHLNSLAASRLSLTSSNTAALALGQDSVSFSTDDPSTEVALPVQLHAGDAIVTVKGEVYYCRTGEEALCLIDDLDLALPVTVVSGAPRSVVTLDYNLPAVPDG
jgi:DNA-binding beta-propeller fold protein YncE